MKQIMNIKHYNKNTRAGFTLVEILVVITIIIILGSLVVASLGWVEKNRQEKQIATMVERLKTGIVQFYADSGYYPDGNGDENSTSAVYEVLFGDYNHDGIPDKDPRRGNVRNEVYVEQLDPEFQGGAKWVRKADKKYVIIDTWEQPLRYTLGWQQKDSKKKDGMGCNPDFDIWSIGADAATDLKTCDKKGANKDDIGYKY